jgi:FAD/FMN-containing dehydrogenase
VRGGGHNGAGLGVCDRGLVIDLSSMKGVLVNPATNTIWAEAGCTQPDLNHAAHDFGLAVPLGVISSTGIAGLTLGGGMGYLTRKYGLTVDNLLEADLVLADGRFVTASATESPDLFWAIRGGGGNFGIVTSFLFRGCPVELPRISFGDTLEAKLPDPAIVGLRDRNDVAVDAHLLANDRGDSGRFRALIED